MPAGAGIQDFDDLEYKPKFHRLSTERRVLGFVTDAERNTFEQLQEVLDEDENTSYAGNKNQLERYLADLVDAGLLMIREDGTYAVTDAGQYELSH